jgi:hypothetical protein
MAGSSVPPGLGGADKPAPAGQGVEDPGIYPGNGGKTAEECKYEAQADARYPAGIHQALNATGSGRRPRCVHPRDGYRRGGSGHVLPLRHPITGRHGQASTGLAWKVYIRRCAAHTRRVAQAPQSSYDSSAP